MVKNINKANSGLAVYIGMSMQFRKSEHIFYYKPNISVDMKIVFKYQLLFQPYLCKGQCLGHLTLLWNPVIDLTVTTEECCPNLSTQGLKRDK